MSEVLKSIAIDLKTLEPQIAEATELVAIMKEAGESVTDMERDLRSLKIKQEKWQKILKSRGYG